METSKLLIFAGQIFKTDEFVSAQDLQHFITLDIENGYMIPLAEVSVILDILTFAGFLEKIGTVYTPVRKEYTKKESTVANWDKNNIKGSDVWANLVVNEV